MENRRKSKGERERGPGRAPGAWAGSRQSAGWVCSPRAGFFIEESVGDSLAGQRSGRVLFGKSRRKDKIIDGAPNSD
jgi:hypothetical protein